jgi:hypothetical protein
VEKFNSQSTVVWNPWTTQKMPDDFDPAEHKYMVCVESGNVKQNKISLAPGKSAALKVVLSSPAGAAHYFNIACTTFSNLLRSAISFFRLAFAASNSEVRRRTKISRSSSLGLHLAVQTPFLRERMGELQHLDVVEWFLEHDQIGGVTQLVNHLLPGIVRIGGTDDDLEFRTAFPKMTDGLHAIPSGGIRTSTNASA